MNQQQAIYRLRAALFDACRTCSKCGGNGQIAAPGMFVACSRCTYWRATLEETRATPGRLFPRRPWFLRWLP